MPLVRVSALVQVLQFNAQVRDLLVQKGVHRSLLQAYWSLEKLGWRDVDDYLPGIVILETLSAMRYQLRTPLCEMVSFMEMFLEEEYFLPLVGKVVLDGAILDAEHKVLLQNVEALMKAWPRADPSLDNIVKPAWLHILDSILAIGRTKGFDNDRTGPCSIRERVELWRRFGSHLGLDEVAVRQEMADLRSVKMGRLMACGWAQCPVFEVPMGKELLRCSTCRTVQYCSFHCQRMHWTEGEHRLACREPSISRLDRP